MFAFCIEMFALFTKNVRFCIDQVEKAVAEAEQADTPREDAVASVEAHEFEDPAEKAKKEMEENDEIIKTCQDELGTSATVVCAFVTFLEPEHAEAAAMLYTGFRNGSLIPGCCQKSALRFEGRKVTAARAAEPGDQMWENHGYGWKELLLRRSATAVFSIVMLAVSSGLLYYANKAKAVGSVPALCPIVVCDTAVAPFTTDAVCVETAHGLSVVHTGNAADCAGVTGLALATSAACDAFAHCSYLDTSVELISTHNVTCAAQYTEAELTVFFRSTNAAKKGSCIGAASYCLGLDFPSMNAESVLCAEAISQYFENFAIGFIPVVAVIIINTLLKTVLKILVTVEKHHTVSAELAAMTVKLFCAQFLNTSIIVSKNHEFCIKNKKLCIKNKELCIKNKEFCIKMMNCAVFHVSYGFKVTESIHRKWEQVTQTR